jgi:hypothetical protein
VAVREGDNSGGGACVVGVGRWPGWTMAGAGSLGVVDDEREKPSPIISRIIQ